jgi:3-phenylpropionate/trans-cinnamate dioxygenase ferredoxin reductase subunit
MTSVVVVGASLAGLRAAQTLRDEGFDGELTLVGAENRLPYDRPPLSKDILLGEAEPSDIALADDAQYAALDATWVLGRPATGLEPGRVRVGETVLPADGVVIATGGRARVLPHCSMPGVHTLRTLDDALALRDNLKRADRVVVIGAGFIGTEVASAAAAVGCRVTITMAEPTPLVGKVGSAVSEVLRQTMSERGVEQRTGVLVDEMVARDGGAVTVHLTDGARLTADVVVVGCGATPNVEWLSGSAVRMRDGVVIDDWGRTSEPGVVAAGDVACRRQGDGHVRTEHWTHARDMPVVAARTLLAHLRGTEPPDPYAAEPYFWSDQFGLRLQVAGTVDPAREMRVVDGAIADRSFVAAQFAGERLTAIVGFNAPRPFLQWRRRNAPALLAATAVGQ